MYIHTLPIILHTIPLLTAHRCDDPLPKIERQLNLSISSLNMQYTYPVWVRGVLQYMHTPHYLQSKASDGILQDALTAVTTDTSLEKFLQLNSQLVAGQIDNLVKGG